VVRQTWWRSKKTFWDGALRVTPPSSSGVARAAGLEVEVLLSAGGVAALDHHGGQVEGGVGVAPEQVLVHRQVAVRVQLGGVWLEGPLGAEHRLEGFELELDELGARARGPDGFGQDQGHGFSPEAHHVLCEHRLVVHGVAVVQLARHVPPGEHPDHTRDLEGRFRAQGDDASVDLLGPHGHAMQAPIGDRQIGGIAAAARGLVLGVHPPG
jgi:hypothetical protein